MSAIPAVKLKELCEKSRTPLRRYFERRIRGNADAEDLVQEVFIRLARADGCETVANIDGYVCRIAANLVRDHVRRSTVRRCDIVLETDGIAEEAGFSPERILLGRDAIRQVSLLLDELPQRTKTIFLLYHVHIIPQVQIARMLQMPVSTIEKHMCKANAHIYRKLDRGIERRV